MRKYVRLPHRTQQSWICRVALLFLGFRILISIFRGSPLKKWTCTGERHSWTFSSASHIAPESADDRYQALIQHMNEAAEAGLTSVQDAVTSLRTFGLYERASSEGALKLRFRFAPLILPKDGGAPRNHKLETALTEADLAKYRELRETFKGPILKFGAIKGVLDGTMDARTAAMFEPYVGGGT